MAMCDGCGGDHPPSEPCPDGTEWCSGALVCRMCAHEHVSVWPASIVDEECQECPECGNMTAGPSEDEEDEFI